MNRECMLMNAMEGIRIEGDKEDREDTKWCIVLR